MKSVIFNEIQARFTKSFLKRTTDNPSMVKALKINKFIMLRLPEAMKNEVMRIKIVCFGVRTFQNFFLALWDS